MKSRFLSYGAGMQTFALLVMAEQGEIQIDEIVFADTGAEHPSTYEHIGHVVMPIVQRMGIPFRTVRMHKVVEDISAISPGLMARYRAMKTETRAEIPGRTERTRKQRQWCTDNGIPVRTVDNLRDEMLSRRRVPSINPASR